MVIYISINQDNYVEGWGSTRGNESDIEIDLPEDHDFFNSFLSTQSYKFENGVLIKDIHREAALIAERKALREKPDTEEVVNGLQKENEQLKLMIDSLAAYMLTSGE